MDHKIHEVKSVSSLKNFHLLLEFEDGNYRVVDFRPFLKNEGLMADLIKPEFFTQVSVDRDIKTIVWPNGIDVCPDVLYENSIPVNMPGIHQ